MSTVIGIDLGTTNSCVAVVRDGKPEVLVTSEFKQTLHDLHIDEIIGVYQAAYDRMMAEE